MKVSKKILVATMAVLLLVGVNARAGIYTTGTDEGDTITSGVGLASTITSSGFVGNIGDLTVTLNISGGNNGDLYGYLSYNGVLVTILNRPGVTPSNPFGFSSSGYSVTISDTGTVNLNTTAGTPGQPVTGDTFNVNGTSGNGSLAFGSTYGGMDPNGTWTLFLENEVSGGDPSMLVSWSIGINAVPEPTNVALGIFGFCAVAGRLRAGWKKARLGAKPIDEPK